MIPPYRQLGAFTLIETLVAVVLLSAVITVGTALIADVQAQVRASNASVANTQQRTELQTVARLLESDPQWASDLWQNDRGPIDMSTSLLPTPAPQPPLEVHVLRAVENQDDTPDYTWVILTQGDTVMVHWMARPTNQSTVETGNETETPGTRSE